MHLYHYASHNAETHAAVLDTTLTRYCSPADVDEIHVPDFSWLLYRLTYFTSTHSGTATIDPPNSQLQT